MRRNSTGELLLTNGEQILLLLVVGCVLSNLVKHSNRARFLPKAKTWENSVEHHLFIKCYSLSPIPEEPSGTL